MQLGLILAPLGQRVAGQFPNEIGYAIDGSGTFLEPFDPQFNQRGEPGFYFDTMLGGIPTDVELAKSYSEYTPVANAWINAKEGFMPSPWRVPGGWSPAGQFGPERSLNGLSGAVLGLSPIGWIAVAGLVGLGMWAGKHLIRRSK